MKKIKALSRAWFWSYISWLVGGSVPVLLAIRFGVAFPIIMLVLWIAALGLIITARVMYAKKKPFFPTFAYAGQGLTLALALFGLILEIVFTAQGLPAVYAWIMSVLGFIGQSVIMVTVNIYAQKILRETKKQQANQK